MQILSLFDEEGDNFERALRQQAAGNDPVDARRARKLLDLVRYLEAQGPAPRAFAHLFFDELWLTPFREADPAMVHVSVDWKDFGPVQDGIPEMHYRLNYKRAGSELSIDASVRDPDEAERVIWEAFGWGSP